MSNERDRSAPISARDLVQYAMDEAEFEAELEAVPQTIHAYYYMPRHPSRRTVAPDPELLREELDRVHENADFRLTDAELDELADHDGDDCELSRALGDLRRQRRLEIGDAEIDETIASEEELDELADHGSDD